jgi:hypothetical protein
MPRRTPHRIAPTALAATIAASVPAAAQPAPAQAPFVLEARLDAYRTTDANTLTLADVQDGRTPLISGDRVQITIRTSQTAHVYLAMCAQSKSDTAYHGLTIFPERGSTVIAADAPAILPSPTIGIILDDQPGTEVLYVVVAQRELATADAQLAKALDAARPGAQRGECGAQLSPRPAPSTGRRPPTPEPAGTRPRATIERGMYLGEMAPAAPTGSDRPPRPIAADASGVVVVRYQLPHVRTP